MRVFNSGGLILIILLAFPFFFLKYVPLIPGFLAALVPLMVLIFFVTLFNRKYGIILFTFLFPLINGLPYFFGIDLSIPHAPTALILFVVFFLGWSLGKFFKEEELFMPNPLSLTILFITGLLLISAVLAFFRYTAFWPFLADGLYEFATNVNGVTSGGALMSVLFSLLNYLCGFVFFFIVYDFIKTSGSSYGILLSIAASSLVAVGFGFYQRFVDPGLGNTQFWTGLGQINATFKDPNAFAGFLAGLWPVLLGLSLAFRGKKRILSGAAALSILVIFPFIGNRSGFLGILISTVVFAAVLFFSLRSAIKVSMPGDASHRFRLRTLLIAVVVFLTIVLGSLFVLNSSNTLKNRLAVDIRALKAKSLVTISPERYFLWKEALHMIRDFPVSGVGIGSYLIELPNYYSVDIRSYSNNLGLFRRNDSAENYWLHIGAELGGIGLLGFFVLLGLIAYRIFCLIRNPPLKKSQILLFAGVTGGLISLFMGYLFHSYIGSFEVKFLFWMLAAVLFCVNSSKIQTKRPSQGLGFAEAVGMLLFAAFHIWSATHSLSLHERSGKFGFCNDFGWYAAELDDLGREFRWNRGYGGIVLEPDTRRISLSLHAAHPDLASDPLEVRIYLLKGLFREKVLLERFMISSHEWISKRYDFRDANFNEESKILFIKLDRTWSPLDYDAAPDARKLGIAVREVEQRE